MTNGVTIFIPGWLTRLLCAMLFGVVASFAWYIGIMLIGIWLGLPGPIGVLSPGTVALIVYGQFLGGTLWGMLWGMADSSAT